MKKTKKFIAKQNMIKVMDKPKIKKNCSQNKLKCAVRCYSLLFVQSFEVKLYVHILKIVEEMRGGGFSSINYFNEPNSFFFISYSCGFFFENAEDTRKFRCCNYINWQYCL